MTFELTAIVGNSVDGYQFKIKHCSLIVVKRVKGETLEAMRKKGYNVDNVEGSLEI